MKQYTQDLEVGMVYYLKNYTAPKVFTGLIFVCLLTDQIIPSHNAISVKTNKHIKDWDGDIYKSERFNLLKS